MMEELTKTEEKIMQIIWNIGKCLVRDIIEKLPDEPKPPYNTISSVVRLLESKGFLYGASLVWLISTYELAGGMLLAVGLYVRLIATGLFIIACSGILLIHMQNGWFVGEHGTGGMEYSFSLIVSLIVIAAASAESNKSKS